MLKFGVQKLHWRSCWSGYKSFITKTIETLESMNGLVRATRDGNISLANSLIDEGGLDIEERDEVRPFIRPN